MKDQTVPESTERCDGEKSVNSVETFIQNIHDSEQPKGMPTNDDQSDEKQQILASETALSTGWF